MATKLLLYIKAVLKTIRFKPLGIFPQLFLLAALAIGAAPPARAARLKISCGAVGREIELCQTGALSWARATGHQVEVVSAPNNSSDRLALYLQLLAARSDEIDVFVVDTTWPGILADFLVDLRPLVKSVDRDAFLVAFIENNTIKRKLVALPWYADGGVLYYRKDLLEKYGRSVPETWREMTETARFIQYAERARGQRNMWGYVFQGRAYEGLTCNAMEWIASFGGGTLLNRDGRFTFNNRNAAKALRLAASWIGSISPPGVLNYSEEEARGVFQTGNAVFMRNWLYVLTLANSKDSPIRGKFDIAELPRGEPSDRDGLNVSVLGGWSLAISKFSKHPEEAISLIRHLTRPQEQIRRTLSAGFYPALTSLYDDPRLERRLARVDTIQKVLNEAISRPARVTGRKYNQASAEFWETVHQVLSGERAPEDALQRLEGALNHVSRQGKW